MANSKVFGFISCGLLALACFLFILSNALPSWGKWRFDSRIVTEVGLWKSCAKVTSTHCVTVPIQCSGPTADVTTQCIKLIFARAFMVLVCGVSAIGALLLLLAAISENRIAMMFAKGLAFASILCGVIGVAVGISWILYSEVFSLSTAGILGILAVILNVISFVCSILMPSGGQMPTHAPMQYYKN